MSGNVNVSSNYKYLTNSEIIQSDIPEKLAIIQDNLLDFQTVFQDGKWTYGELQRISRELESMGRYFLDQYNLSNTGTLRNSIKAEVSDKTIKFYNDARNSRGQFYAGHIEFGHYSRNGSFVEAFPFMRPALYAVSRASSGNFRDILTELARGVFNTKGGYQGLNNLTFGHKLGKAHRYSVPTNIVRKNMYKKSRLNPEHYYHEHLESQTRSPWSVRRGRNDSKTIEKKKEMGFNTKTSYNPKKSVIKRRRNE